MISRTLAPKDNGGEVLGAKEDGKKNALVVSYRLRKGRKDGEVVRLLTVFSLIPSRYIVTLTGQADDKNWKDVEDDIWRCLNSYQLI